MARPPVLQESDLEIALLRKGVGALAEGRHCCAECGRTPLVGERVFLYARSVVCALCRPRRRHEPDRSDMVRHSERGLAVRVRRRAV